MNNYRPISILLTVECMFEKLLYDQLYEYFTDNNVLGNKQWGFRSQHSTALALYKCTRNWYINIDKGHTSSLVFLDIRKAFVTIQIRCAARAHTWTTTVYYLYE